MTDLPRLAAATTADWSDLVDELDRWGEVGRVARLWWRDDDAVTATPELSRLLDITAEAPVALAVIPAAARPELAAALASAPNSAVLQHGWRHANHASAGKKSEYPPDRLPAEVAAEIAAGRARLEGMFGSRALPVLVPPWNRYAAELLPLLPEAGIAAISVLAGPAAPAMRNDLSRIDVHVDLVAWKAGRGFIGEAAALSGLLGHLCARRVSPGRAAEPVGILTHHLVMEGRAAAFLYKLVALVAAHSAARWASVPELLAI